MKDVRKDHERLLDNLKVIQRQVGAKNLIASLGINKNTWTNRMREPWRLFSYDDLRIIAMTAKIDIVTLIEGSVSIG